MGAIECSLDRSMLDGTALRGTVLSQRRLLRAIAYMRAHIAGVITLHDIARDANLSVYHFARAFRNTTGITPYRYLLGCRIEKVRELLPDCDMPLAEVAALAGFADQSHMCNVFKRLTGETPREFRQRARGVAGRDLRGGDVVRPAGPLGRTG
jgi:AraC family transcriptional regulator